MSEITSGATWRKRMQDLARNLGRPHPPLFAPLAFAVAAQIEAIDPARMVLDGTRLRKNVLELRHVLRTDTVFCAAPSAMEIEALGAPVDHSHWPPRPTGMTDAPDAFSVDSQKLSNHPRVAASLDSVRQLASEASEPVIIAAFTGPATLVGELRAAGCVLDEDAAWDLAGQALAAFVRLYAEAGVNVSQFHEKVLPDADCEDRWKGSLGTVGNVARFHRVPPILVVDADSAPTSWPAQAIPCPTWEQHPASVARAHGRAWAAAPGAWPALPADGPGERLITTNAEIAPQIPIAELKRHVERVRGD
jgi:acetophenone carboxylase